MGKFMVGSLGLGENDFQISEAEADHTFLPSSSMTANLQQLNNNAEVMGRGMSLRINTEAAKGLQSVLKTNLGPRGTLKCLVGGAGQLKLSKDGSCLLSEMQIQHPTALLIARAATATDDTVGDGTSTTVIFCGELLKQADRYLSDGLHPRVIVDGFDEAKRIVGEVLEDFKRPFPDMLKDRELLTSVCRTTLGTKLRAELVGPLTEIVTDAFLMIRREGKVGTSGKVVNIVDLHMVEIMHMAHRMDIESRLVKGGLLSICVCVCGALPALTPPPKHVQVSCWITARATPTCRVA